MKMAIVQEFKLVLLLRLCSVLHIASATYYDQYYDPPNNQDSQSQENTSDMDGQPELQSMRSNRNRNNNYNNNPKPSMQQQLRVIPMSQMPSMPSMSLQLPMPMQLPQPQSQSMPQMPMPQIGIPQMPQLPQMSMPSMPLQQMPMPSMPLPQMSMSILQMPMPMQGPFGSPFPGPFPENRMLYFPMSSQFTNFLKNQIPNQSTTVANTNSIMITTTTQPTVTTTSPATTTAQATTTTQATTTSQATTTTTTAIPLTYPERQRNDYRQIPMLIKSRSEQNNILATVLKNAIEDYSNIIMKSSERTNNANNRLMLTSMRKTQPTWVPKYGIVPITNNMAQRLMTQMRDMKGIRGRPKRLAIFKAESLLF